MMGHESKYSVLLLKIIFIVLAVFSFNISFTQDIYRTQNGSILITAVSSDSIITLSSKEVIMTLNNETAKFKMTLDKSSLRSDNIKINEKLSLMKFDEIEISGKFDIGNIDRHDHIPLEFNVEGIILTKNKALLGRGRLEHISSEGNISCLLTLKFILDKNDLDLNLDSLNNEIQVDVVQVFLNN